MIKKLLAMSFSLLIATPSIAVPAFIPHGILKPHHPSQKLVKNRLPSYDKHTDFSGNWVGSCDNYPDEIEEMNIGVTPDYSYININGREYQLGAISSESSHGHDQQENVIGHMRWSPDGQEILFTTMFYYKDGDLNQGDFYTGVGNGQLSIDNAQLILKGTFTYFADGAVVDPMEEFHCVYHRQNKK